MSEKINLDVDTSEAERKLAELDARIRILEEKLLDTDNSVEEQDENIGETEVKLIEMVETVDDETAKSEKEVIEMMQESYEKQAQLVEDVEDKARESMNNVIGMMRASYMIISGFSQAVGGNMGQIFSSMYAVAVSAIATYSAIRDVMAESGVGIPQAILMTISLSTAIAGLVATMSGQKELAQRISGMNMALHGISALIGDAYYL